MHEIIVSILTLKIGQTYTVSKEINWSTTEYYNKQVGLSKT